MGSSGALKLHQPFQDSAAGADLGWSKSTGIPEGIRRESAKLLRGNHILRCITGHSCLAGAWGVGFKQLQVEKHTIDLLSCHPPQPDHPVPDVPLELEGFILTPDNKLKLRDLLWAGAQRGPD